MTINARANASRRWAPVANFRFIVPRRTTAVQRPNARRGRDRGRRIIVSWGNWRRMQRLRGLADPVLRRLARRDETPAVPAALSPGEDGEGGMIGSHEVRVCRPRRRWRRFRAPPVGPRPTGQRV
jgi:hypothetical protein